MSLYGQIALIAGVLLIASLLHDCLKQLQQLNNRSLEIDLKLEKSARAAEEIYSEMLSLQDSVRAVEKVASQFDIRQPHPFE